MTNNPLEINNNRDPYESVPICIRQYYSRDEWLCLSDAQKTNLIQSETEPEC